MAGELRTLRGMNALRVSFSNTCEPQSLVRPKNGFHDILRWQSRVPPACTYPKEPRVYLASGQRLDEEHFTVGLAGGRGMTFRTR